LLRRTQKTAGDATASAIGAALTQVGSALLCSSNGSLWN